MVEMGCVGVAGEQAPSSGYTVNSVGEYILLKVTLALATTALKARCS